VLGIPERSALPRCVRSIQWIRSDRWVVAGSRGPLSSVVSRSGGGDKHADESPSRRRGPRALVSISVSPRGSTRAPRRGTRPRVALTLSSLGDGKRERLAWRSLRRSSGRGDAARDDYRFEAEAAVRLRAAGELDTTLSLDGLTVASARPAAGANARGSRRSVRTAPCRARRPDRWRSRRPPESGPPRRSPRRSSPLDAGAGVGSQPGAPRP
jgi:hypothetical protein